MAKDSTVQSDPTSDVAPQQDPDNQGAADVSLEGKSATELLALAGDENARRALGQPTAGEALRSVDGYDGFTLGEPAPSDLYRTFDGKIVTSADGGSDGFRGVQVAVKGATVTAATLAELAASTSA